MMARPDHDNFTAEFPGDVEVGVIDTENELRSGSHRGTDLARIEAIDRNPQALRLHPSDTVRDVDERTSGIAAQIDDVRPPPPPAPEPRRRSLRPIAAARVDLRDHLDVVGNRSRHRAPRTDRRTRAARAGRADHARQAPRSSSPVARDLLERILARSSVRPGRASPRKPSKRRAIQSVVMSAATAMLSVTISKPKPTQGQAPGAFVSVWAPPASGDEADAFAIVRRRRGPL